MNSFKVFFEETNKSPVFSEKEKINIKDAGAYVAKVDTGNDAFCVLHGEEINVDQNNKRVTFKTDKGDKIEKDLIDTIKVNVGAGVEEDRPIVCFDIKLKGKVYKDVKFSIGNRKDNDEKVLLGLKFLKPLKAIVKV